MAFLVYVKGLRGLTAEKWPELLRDMSGKVRPFIKNYELGSDYARLSINELVMWFPPPVVVESA